MRVHVVQHVEFEGPGCIRTWVENNGLIYSSSLISKDENLPDPGDIDLLVLMGGPMSVYEDQRYPWLRKEKRYIEKCIGREKKILGICLGAQLVADVLGASVRKGFFKEIGWHPVFFTSAAELVALVDGLPDVLMPFHWHGDVFDIPDGAVRLARSAACVNQAFSYGGNILGMQFHLESSPRGIDELIRNCSGEIEETDEPYIQSSAEIVKYMEYSNACNEMMIRILDNFSLGTPVHCR